MTGTRSTTTRSPPELVAQLRKKPPEEPETLMQLLRPQQKQPKPVRKSG